MFTLIYSANSDVENSEPVVPVTVSGSRQPIYNLWKTLCPLYDNIIVRNQIGKVVGPSKGLSSMECYNEFQLMDPKL